MSGVAPKSFDRAELAEVSFLYYIRNMSQEDIAGQVGVSRPVVSRMLSMARQQSVVTFHIDFPVNRRADLESLLLARWAGTRLNQVIVTEGPVDDFSALSNPLEPSGFLGVAHAGAAWLEKKVFPGVQIGLSWGTTAQTVVDLVKFETRMESTVVQLAGEVSFDGVKPAYDVVRTVAEKLGGNYHYMSVPASAPSQEIARLLVEGTHLRESMERAGACDVAVLGIGALGAGNTERFLEYAQASSEERAQAEAAGAVGQISSLLFNAHGDESDIVLNNRLFSVSLQQIRGIPDVALVASGGDKAHAVAGALAGSLGSTLIIDVPLAEKILEVTS